MPTRTASRSEDAGARGGAGAGRRDAEAREPRPADRRARARLQQSSDGRPRQSAVARKRARTKLADLARRAMEAAEAGAVLTKRMLAFARRQVLKPETVSLSDVVKGMSDMMAHSLGPSVRIAVDLPPRSSPGSDRSESARSRFAQSRSERAATPCSRGERFDQGQNSRRRFAGRPCAGAICAPFGLRYRRRDGRGDTEARLRAVLHDQGDGQGLRARTFDGAGALAAIWRGHAHRKPTRRGLPSRSGCRSRETRSTDRARERRAGSERGSPRPAGG